MASASVHPRDSLISLPANSFTPSGWKWMKWWGVASQIAAQGYRGCRGRGMPKQKLEAETTTPSCAADVPTVPCEKLEEALLRRCTAGALGQIYMSEGDWRQTALQHGLFGFADFKVFQLPFEQVSLYSRKPASGFPSLSSRFPWKCKSLGTLQADICTLWCLCSEVLQQMKKSKILGKASPFILFTRWGIQPRLQPFIMLQLARLSVNSLLW